MITLLLSKPYRALEPRLAAYLRRYLATHHATYADWVPEISEPMLRHLVLDGVRRAFTSYVFLMAIMGPTLWYTEESRLSTIAFAVLMLVVFLADWRRLATQSLEREFAYRRQHRKWRWEH